MLTLKQCGISDLEAVVALNETVYEGLSDKTLLRHNTREMLASCLYEPNVTLGIWDGAVLVAAGIFYVPQTIEEDHVHDLNLPGAYKSGNQKLFLVRESYRGRGLQRRLIREIEKMAFDRGYNLLCTTCAPGNMYSIANFEKEGYTYAKTERKYGGMIRNLYFKVIR